MTLAHKTKVAFALFAVPVALRMLTRIKELAETYAAEVRNLTVPLDVSK